MDGRQALVILHAFADAPSEITVPLAPSGGWRMSASFGSGDHGIDAAHLRWQPRGDFAGLVLLCDRLEAHS